MKITVCVEGGAGTGKTTLLRRLSAMVPELLPHGDFEFIGAERNHPDADYSIQEHRYRTTREEGR